MNRNYTHSRSFITFNSIPNSVYYLQKYNIPGISIKPADQNTRFVNIPHPGDKIEYNQFNTTFIMNEDFTNFVELWNWVKNNNSADNISDFTLHIYSNTIKKIVVEFDFIGAWISNTQDIQIADFATNDDTTPKLLDCLFYYAYYTPRLIDTTANTDIIIGEL